MKVTDGVSWYKDAYHNLMLAIVIQAAEDMNGYRKDNKFVDGKEATDFINTTGKQMYEYLSTHAVRCKDINNY